MDWNDLRFVLALARAGSLTQAARELAVTHTTVARRIKAFEDALGSQVFDKHPDGYIVTATGQEIVGVAERMEDQMLSLDRSVAGQDSRLRGLVRFATLDSFAAHNGDLLERFFQRYPGIDLEITTANNFVSLTRREADVALRWTASPPEQLVGRRLGRFEYAVYGARQLVERMGATTPLDQYRWISWDPRLGAHITERWLKTHVPRARIALYADSGAVMGATLRAGVGIAHAVCFDGDKNDDLVRLRPVEEGWGMDLWILTHPDLRRAARVRAVMDYFSEELAKQRELMSGALGADPVPAPPCSAEQPVTV